MTKEANNLVESVTLATSVAYTKKEVTKLREEFSELITSLTPEVVYEYVEGPSGKDGLDGVRGEKGDKGDQGPSGKDGINGEKGDRGEKGEQGIQGVAGEKGDKGDQGEQGIAGVDGKDGKDGRDGTDGKDGEQGIQGIQGLKGDKGEPGIQGLAGQNGKDGIDGKDGRDGVDGKDGTNGKNGRDGKDGKVGPKGDKGDKGDAGEKGEQGEPGLPGKDGDFAPLQEKFTNFQKILEQDLNNYKNKINAVVTTKGFGGETAGSGSYWLNDLGDTDKLSIENATDGQVLTFSASEGKWVAADSTGGGGGTTDATARAMAQGAFDEANTADILAQSAYTQANSANVLAQAAFDTANIANTKTSNTLIWVTNSPSPTTPFRSSVTLDANGVTITESTGVPPYFNTPSIWNLSYGGTLTFPDSTQQNTAFTGYATDNTARSIAQSAFNYANSIPLLDQTARNIGNNATTMAQASYNTGNVIFAFANSAYNEANSAYTLASNKFNSSGGTISGNVSIQGSLSVSGNITYTGNVTTQTITGNTGEFFGFSANGFNAFYAGIPTGFAVLPNEVAEFSASNNSYTQVNFQNENDGTQATTDWIATAGNGNDTTYYVDLGIAGSGYVNTNPNNSLGTSLYPNDSYLYAQGALTAGQPGGNLVIGTATSNTSLRILVGGVNSQNVVTTFTPTSANLSVPLVFSDGSTQTTAYTSAVYNQANTGILLAQSAFNTANSASANTVITQGVDATQNTNITIATALAQASFNYANTIPLLDQTARNLANTANINAISAGTYANSSYVQANTGTVLAQAAYNYANTIPLLDQTARNLANTSNTNAINAGTYANTAFVTANTASSNTVYLQGALNSSNANITLAYAQANTGTVLAQAAFNTANSASSNTIISQGVELTQNTNITNATTLAQNAYNEANTAFNTGNSAFITANSAFSKANNALANTTGTFNGGLTFGSASGFVVNNLASNNYVSVGSGHSQLFDDGNLHLHANTGAIWINPLDSSAVRIGTQYNSGSGSGLYVQGGIQSATTDPSQSSFFPMVKTNWNVNQPSLAMDNLNVRLRNTSGDSLIIEASAVSGSFTAYTTLTENIAGNPIRGTTNSGGITFSAGTWTSVNAYYELSSGGDTTVMTLSDTTTGKIYRVTLIHTNGNTNGSIFIERMV